MAFNKNKLDPNTQLNYITRDNLKHPLYTFNDISESFRIYEKKGVYFLHIASKKSSFHLDGQSFNIDNAELLNLQQKHIKYKHALYSLNYNIVFLGLASKIGEYVKIKNKSGNTDKTYIDLPYLKALNFKDLSINLPHSTLKTTNKIIANPFLQDDLDKTGYAPSTKFTNLLIQTLQNSIQIIENLQFDNMPEQYTIKFNELKNEANEMIELIKNGTLNFEPFRQALKSQLELSHSC